jgi:hypothetical protein
MYGVRYNTLIRNVMHKVKFTSEQAMKVQRAAEVQYYSSFNLGARQKWVINATPRPLYPPGKRPGNNCTGSWVGPSGGLDEWGISRPFIGTRSLDRPV